MKKKKKVKSRFLPLDQATAHVQQYLVPLGINTRHKYWKWHDDNPVPYLPKYPHRVYKDWAGWNPFLGQQNSFEKTYLRNIKKTKTYRTYWEAVRYAQGLAGKHNIENQYQWRDRYEELNIPEDIPKYPEQVYDGFSWKVWLNKTITAKVETARADVSIICFHTIKGEPSNVVRMKVWKDGYVSMMNQLKDNDNELNLPNSKCIWKNEPGAIEYTTEMLNKHGTIRDNNYIIPNVSALIWDMMELEIYRL